MNIPPKIVGHRIRSQSPNPSGSPLSETSLIPDVPAETPDQQADHPGFVPELSKTQSAIRSNTGPAQIEKTPDSLPVLEAFQAFLEAERSKTRKRAILLVSVFVLILLCITAGGTFMGIAAFKKLDHEFMSESSSLKKDTQTILTRIMEDVNGFCSDINSKQTEIEQGNSEISSQLTSYDKEILKLRKIMEAIKDENVSLKQDLVNMQSDLPKLSSRVEQAVAEFEKMQVLPVPQSTAVVNLVMSITPRGRHEAVTWRIPIPE